MKWFTPIVLVYNAIYVVAYSVSERPLPLINAVLIAGLLIVEGILIYLWNPDR